MRSFGRKRGDEEVGGDNKRKGGERNNKQENASNTQGSFDLETFGPDATERIRRAF